MFNSLFRLELFLVLDTVLEFSPLLGDRMVLFVTNSLSLTTDVLNGRVPHGKNAAYTLQTGPKLLTPSATPTTTVST